MYCIVLCCITFSYIVLYYVVLHCIPLYCVLVNFIRLSSLILNCSIFYFFTSNRCLRKEWQITKNLCVWDSRYSYEVRVKLPEISIINHLFINKNICRKVWQIFQNILYMMIPSLFFFRFDYFLNYFLIYYHPIPFKMIPIWTFFIVIFEGSYHQYTDLTF